jgi:hypothetical protein
MQLFNYNKVSKSSTTKIYKGNLNLKRFEHMDKVNS